MRRYVQAFFRHPFLLTMPIVLAVALSLATQVRQPRTYSASTTMWCDVAVPNQSTIFSGTSDMPSSSQSVVLTELLQTRVFMAKVAQSGPWAASLAANPGAASDRMLTQLGGDVSVATLGPHVLSVSTKASSPEDALALAKSVAGAYIAEVNDTLRARAQSSVGFYQVQVTDANKALAAAQDKLNKYVAANQGSGPLGASVDAMLTHLTQAVADAQSNYDLASNRVTSAGVGLSNVSDSGVLRIFDPPRTTGLPVSHKKKIIFGAVLGIFAGLMVSLCTLLFLVVGDRSVRGTGDVEDVLGMQVIGTIDQFKTKIRRGKSAS